MKPKPLLFLFVLVLFSHGCYRVNEPSNTELTLRLDYAEGVSVKINTYDLLSRQARVMAQAYVDSIGITRFALDLDAAVFAPLKLRMILYPLYLIPGADLEVLLTLKNHLKSTVLKVKVLLLTSTGRIDS